MNDAQNSLSCTCHYSKSFLLKIRFQHLFINLHWWIVQWYCFIVYLWENCVLLVFFKRIYNYVILWRDSSLNCCPSQIETNNNTTRDLYYFWFIALSIFVNRNNFLTESDEEQKTVYLLINAKIRVRCAIRNHSSRK